MLHPLAADLVGRSAEIRRLTALLDRAAAAQPGVALVSGEAGVGKSRLVTELNRLAIARGFLVLSGHCAELGDSMPYLPLADALRNAVPSQAGAAPLQEALAARPVLHGLLPDRNGAGRAGAPDLAQQRLFGAVLGMLAELAARAPVLLVLEDMHWADRSTRDLLTFLSRVLHRERVALVATYRSDDVHRGHPLRAVTAELLRLPSVTLVELGPLDPAAMAEHLLAVAEQPPGPAALAAIIRRAEGNTYYAEELLAAEAVSNELPTGLADLMLDRVHRLSPVAQQILRAAAVAGRRVDDELVMTASGQDPGQYDAAVREAVASQLLVPDGAGGYAFRHALLREAIYADLLPGERTRLHARLAGLLADEQRLALVPGTAAALAHHCLASHDIPGAFEASVLAGREADRLAAKAEAHRHFSQAVELWDRVREPERLAGLQRGWLAFDSAICAAASGDTGRSVQELTRLLGSGLASADQVLASRAGERLAFLQLEIGDVAAAVAAARSAVAARPADAPGEERPRAMATYALTLLHAGDLAPARDWAQRAIQAARAAAIPAVEADALVTLGQLDDRAGRPAAATELFSKAYRLAAGGRLGPYLSAAFQKARMHLERGDLADAAATAHEGLDRAVQAGLSRLPYALDLQFMHFLTHFADGDWDHAADLADGFAVRVTTAREALLSVAALYIDVARGHDMVAERLAWLEQSWAADPLSEYLGRSLAAEHALWQGDADTAAAEIRAAIGARSSYQGTHAPQLIRMGAIGLAAEADRARRARLSGDAQGEAAAVAAARRLLAVARDGAASRSGPDWTLGVAGRGWLARAQAEWTRVQGQADPGAWQAVLAEFTPAFRYETALTRWRLAEALVAAGDREQAQSQWRQALEEAGRLRARPLQEALTSLGRRSRLGHDQAAGPGPAGPLRHLTAREIEVLRLLAAGRSNKEIAGALFITPKTASVHVSNILAKLRAASRTEAAAIAHAEGIGLPDRPGSGS
jgi:DNA-binding CsgD family transcriptional regulator/tetratricopeptide (TPR) repeat protein